VAGIEAFRVLHQKKHRLAPNSCVCNSMTRAVSASNTCYPERTFLFGSEFQPECGRDLQIESDFDENSRKNHTNGYSPPKTVFAPRFL
jgi:hypothetical protein